MEPTLQAIRYDYVHLPPQNQIGYHQQTSWELSYIIVGSGTRFIGDVAEEFGNGDMVLIPPGVSHCWIFDEHTTDEEGKISNITVTFSTDILRELSGLFPSLKSCIDKLLNCEDAVVFNKDSSKGITQMLMKMIHKSDAERIPLFLELLLALDPENPYGVESRIHKIDKKQQRIEQIKVFVVCNVARRISIDMIASHVGMTKSAFCIYFKKTFGKTFIDYLTEYKMGIAKKMLAETNMRISDIIAEIGYDAPYFNRLFRRTNGMTPTVYRESTKKSDQP